MTNIHRFLFCTKIFGYLFVLKSIQMSHSGCEPTSQDILVYFLRLPQNGLKDYSYCLPLYFHFLWPNREIEILSKWNLSLDVKSFLNWRQSWKTIYFQRFCVPIIILCANFFKPINHFWCFVITAVKYIGQCGEFMLYKRIKLISRLES